MVQKHIPFAIILALVVVGAIAYVQFRGEGALAGEAINIKATMMPSTPVTTDGRIIITNGKACKFDRQCNGFAWNYEKGGYLGKSVCYAGFCTLQSEKKKEIVKCDPFSGSITSDILASEFAAVASTVHCESLGRYYHCQQVYDASKPMKFRVQNYCVEKKNLPPVDGKRCIRDTDCALYPAGGDYGDINNGLLGGYKYNGACVGGFCQPSTVSGSRSGGGFIPCGGYIERGEQCELMSNINVGGDMVPDRRFICGKYYYKISGQIENACLEPWE